VTRAKLDCKELSQVLFSRIIEKIVQVLDPGISIINFAGSRTIACGHWTEGTFLRGLPGVGELATCRKDLSDGLQLHAENDLLNS
jgi:hypothetical protein